jgi:uncharacterized protein (DUF3084 family)
MGNLDVTLSKDSSCSAGACKASMSSGIILILAVLILGGVIATVGDRIGTRVGKARLSLFNLRPKKTAVLVTILTGGFISATTMALLLVTNERLRVGIFQLGQIERKLSGTRNTLKRTLDDLQKTMGQKTQVEQELSRTKTEQARVQTKLDRINQSLKESIVRQSQAETQRKRAETQRDVIRGQLSTVSEQALKLRSEISQLQSERQILITQRDQVKQQIAQRDAEIAQRNAVIEQRDREIADRDTVIAQRESRLKELEAQQAYLAQKVQLSEQEADLIRRGILRIQRNQVLASAVVRITNPSMANQAVDQLLRKANEVALRAVQPGVSDEQQILQITNPEVQQLVDQIDDGQDYVVRIIAAANYVQGEKTAVAVFADAVRNQVLFLAGDVIASKSIIEPSKLSTEDLNQSITQLVAASNFRARRAGVLTEGVQIDRLQTWSSFIEQLRQYDSSVELRIVAAEVTYTVGPLKIELVAVQNGQVILRTS